MARKKSGATNDSYHNFIAQAGLGANNQSSAGIYEQNFITKLRPQLEAMYRTSWIVGNVVDIVADDMTQSGVDFVSQSDPEDLSLLHDGLEDLQIWQGLNETIKWSRLYGSAILILIIEGQDLATPLRMETISKDSFMGCISLDRWQLNPSNMDLISTLGPDFGKPEYYVLSGSANLLSGVGKVHHSRVIRMDGIELPWNQRRVEQYWGESVIERMYDRILAFDSATAGVAQMVFKAHLRTWGVEGLRQIIATNTTAMQGVLKNMEMIRAMQTNEGITLMDSTDTFETHTYNFAGLDDVLLKFSEQISGACEIPLVRLLGQSPGGLNSSGDSDIRTYYDGIRKKQETRLRRPLKRILEVLHRSIFEKPLPDGFRFNFRPLWQMSDKEKAEIANVTTDAITKSLNAGIISPRVALTELRQSSEVTGIFSSITDEDINAADEEPPKSEDMGNQPEEDSADKL